MASSWVSRLSQEVERLTGLADEGAARRVGDGPQAFALASARKCLKRAEDEIARHQRFSLFRLLNSSSSYRVALSQIHVAAEHLVAVQSHEDLLSQVPALAAAVRAQLDPDDKRREDYLTYLRTIPGQPAAPVAPAAVREGVHDDG
jgi:hypothetical protein